METVVSIDAPDAVIPDTLEAQAILWNKTFSFVKSMSLKCAAELRIPDAILCHGTPTTISDLISSLSIPEAKSRHLRTLMRILSQDGIFKSQITLSGEETFDLTPVSRLLTTTSVSQRRLNYTPFILTQVENHIINSYHQLSHWFHRPDVTITPFEMAHGKTLWELAGKLPEFNDSFNKGMACDSAFVADVIKNIGGEVFRGIGTLVDVGGGTGLMAAALVEAFPGLQCTVFDLPHVIDTAEKTEGIQFAAGDMFVEIPAAHAALLKWILHDWNDEACIKILERCKEAIPSKENGGKVIIIDMVVGVGVNAQIALETQLLLDLHMMTLFGGKERNETEWSKLFIAAGFSGYKITASIVLRSIIEVYP
ncbi:trans-resveratrol di-O-methyltransferase-like [Dendrobium catenatum]|uniref:Trans-resveratrol di-O-methyltransferase n=1 Tax=Dendrobium catenatum TaxID=906689 RepID=A0A2I0X1R5_9ASPA|nr:trans-resveratrol di-O-methyltransferase-like [Dendrobium catenatum]PKU81856.1 Trans-resveratrol di-O-methyltransferase [Dendrobium catenatum]